MLLVDERQQAGSQRAGELTKPSCSLDLMSCLKGDSHGFGKDMRQQTDGEQKDNMGIGKDEIVERKPEREFGYSWLKEETENSQSTSGLEWGGRFVGYRQKDSTCVYLCG